MLKEKSLQNIMFADSYQTNMSFSSSSYAAFMVSLSKEAFIFLQQIQYMFMQNLSYHEILPKGEMEQKAQLIKWL